MSSHWAPVCECFSKESCVCQSCKLKKKKVICLPIYQLRETQTESCQCFFVLIKPIFFSSPPQTQPDPKKQKKTKGFSEKVKTQQMRVGRGRRERNNPEQKKQELRENTATFWPEDRSVAELHGCSFSFLEPKVTQRTGQRAAQQLGNSSATTRQQLGNRSTKLSNTQRVNGHSFCSCSQFISFHAHQKNQWCRAETKPNGFVQ